MDVATLALEVAAETWIESPAREMTDDFLRSLNSTETEKVTPWKKLRSFRSQAAEGGGGGGRSQRDAQRELLDALAELIERD